MVRVAISRSMRSPEIGPRWLPIGLAAAGALAVNVSLIEKMPFDVTKDLLPITLVPGPLRLSLSRSPKFEPSTLKDVIAAAKSKRPGELSIGHGGNGTAMHLTAALFNQLGGVTTTLVPYTRNRTGDSRCGGRPHPSRYR